LRGGAVHKAISQRSQKETTSKKKREARHTHANRILSHRGEKKEGQDSIIKGRGPDDSMYRQEPG